MKLEYAVGIPVRNEEHTIIQTIESVLMQTIAPQEILVCVNGSSDNTYSKVKDMALAERNINLITSNPGKPNAWNKIVIESLENNIMFCDGDVIINSEAAENMLAKFTEKPDLIIVGGYSQYSNQEDKTIFSRYCTENTRLTKQEGISGRLYMTKIKELLDLANKDNIKMMPPNIINEDAFLGLVTKGYRETIDSAYNISSRVSTFHDWKTEFKRILAGQKQLKQTYPKYFRDSDYSMKKLQRYITRYNQITDWKKKIGVASLFIIKTALIAYYNFFDDLDYTPVWQETKSTKTELTNYQPVKTKLVVESELAI